jgi:hypothetical protein
MKSWTALVFVGVWVLLLTALNAPAFYYQYMGSKSSTSLNPYAEPTLTPNTKPGGAVVADCSYAHGGSNSNGSNASTETNYLHNLFVGLSSGQTVWIGAGCSYDIANTAQNYSTGTVSTAAGSTPYEIDINTTNITVMCAGDGISGFALTTGLLPVATNEGLVVGRGGAASGANINGCTFSNTFVLNQSNYYNMEHTICTNSTTSSTCPNGVYTQGGNDPLLAENPGSAHSYPYFTFKNNKIIGEFAGSGFTPYNADIENNVFVDQGLDNVMQCTNCGTITFKDNWIRNSDWAFLDNVNFAPGGSSNYSSYATNGVISNNTFVCTIPPSWETYPNTASCSGGYTTVRGCDFLIFGCDSGSTSPGCNYSNLSVSNNTFYSEYTNAGSVQWSTSHHIPDPGPSAQNSYAGHMHDVCTVPGN